MVNRHGLASAGTVAQADGTAERRAAGVCSVVLGSDSWGCDGNGAELRLVFVHPVLHRRILDEVR
jgi:hypothetical protein